MISIREKVTAFKTKYEEGFIPNEIFDLLELFPDIDTYKFLEAMNGRTGIIIGKDMITYKTDVERALISAMPSLKE